eukprot:3168903-Pyramimonas_sp.AAC.1
MAGCAVVQVPFGSGWCVPGPKCAIRALGSPPMGMHQSIDGAELLAVPTYLCRSLAPITVRIDARYVVDGLQLAFFLWRMVWSAIVDLGGLGTGGLTVRKVKRHGTLRDVGSGRLSRWERRGDLVTDDWAKRDTRPCTLGEAGRSRFRRSHL